MLMKRKLLLYFLMFTISATSAFSQYVRQNFALKDVNTYTQRPVLTAYSIPDKKLYTRVARESDFAICPCHTGCQTLPVTLLSFNAERTSDLTVLVTWKTTNEIQNRGFEVERSYNNIDRFIPIGFVQPQTGNAREKKYTLTDDNDYENNTFYRLKQMDNDGGFVYSETVLVKGIAKTAALNVYPNPVVDNVTARMYFPGKGSGEIVVVNAMQQVLVSQKISYNKGTITVTLPASALAKGLYYIKVITTEGKIISGKFVK